MNSQETKVESRKTSYQKRKTFFALFAIFFALFSCNPSITTDPTAKLTFSTDTVCFDTVFTAQGSATSILMVYNTEKKAIHIDRISLQNGSASPFHLNIDGLTNSESVSEDITLESNDSLFIFVRVNIDPTDSLTPVFVSDRILFSFNDKTQTVELEAFGQDVEIIRSTIFRNDTTLSGKKPYLIYDYAAIDTAKTLTIAAGSRFYFHDKAQLVVFGNLIAQGTLEQPITMQSDRIDHLFTQVPYSMVAGRWDGLYLVQIADRPEAHYDINYLETQSGAVGLYCINRDPQNLHPSLRLYNSMIHNFNHYGLVLQDIDAQIVNCQISNCAQYCVYLAGGKHDFIHTTIASYYNNTDVRIQSTPREDMAAVYINDLYKTTQQMQTSFYNSIIMGVRSNQLVLATPFEEQYKGVFSHCYLRNDSISLPQFSDITYYQKEDTVFKNVFYKYKEYINYDFTLDSVSPCLNIADTAVSRLYPLDRRGRNRFDDQHPDLGCYEL